MKAIYLSTLWKYIVLNFSPPSFDWLLVLEMKLAVGYVLIFAICKQANEVVKANNLAEKVIVLHGRVEVGFSSLAYWCVCSLNCSYVLTGIICLRIWENSKHLYMLTLATWSLVSKSGVQILASATPSTIPRLSSLLYHIDTRFKVLDLIPSSNLLKILIIHTHM